MSSSLDRRTARLFVLSAGLLVFSTPRWWPHWSAAPVPYGVITIVFAAIMLALVTIWDGHVDGGTGSVRSPTDAWVVGLAAAAVLLYGAYRLVDMTVWVPLDPYRADMLVVTREAIGSFLHGHDPYGLYRVPWEAPMPYGPGLWAPFLLPALAHADLRIVTIAGELFVPAAAAVAAVVDAARGRPNAATLWLIVIALFLFSPDLAAFTLVGHTPSYWPLLPLFAALVQMRRWLPAGAALGLLVASRSTMVSLVPVFAITVWVGDRQLTWKAMLAVAIVIAVLFVPFAVWDVHAWWYGMVASYPRIMKEVVWPSLDRGVMHTIGVTGWLLSHGLARLVEATQVGALLLVYAAAYRTLRRGGSPLPWMALALLAFSMTSLWPVTYLYFDVLLLLMSAAIVDTLDLGRAGSLAGRWAASAAMLTLAVGLLTIVVAGGAAADAGSARRMYRRTEQSAVVSLPRGRAVASTIAIRGRSANPLMTAETLTATLNGTRLGTVIAPSTEQTIAFRAPAEAWIRGANALEIAWSTPDGFILSRVDVQDAGVSDHRSPR